jgi:hypothetical protein
MNKDVINNIDSLTSRILYYVERGYKPEKMVRKIVQEWMEEYTNDVMQVVYNNGRSLFKTEMAFAKGQANKEEALNEAIMSTIEAIKANELLSTAIRIGKRKAQKHNRETSKTLNEF